MSERGGAGSGGLDHGWLGRCRPRGRRPFRVHVNTEADGAHVADPVVDRVRAEFLRRAGLGDLLTVRAPAANEERS